MSSGVLMSQKIYTISVSLRDPKTLAFMEELKAKCKRTGQSFSWIVLQALKEHEGKTDVQS